MTLRQEMISTASRAVDVLGESVNCVGDFVSSQINPDGGFRGRDGKSDLYYTSFGIDCLCSLDCEIPKDIILSYLKNCCTADALDLVHFASLVRSLENIESKSSPKILQGRISDSLKRFAKQRPRSAYDFFFTVALYQDLGFDIPEPEAIAEMILSLESADRGFVNDLNVYAGSVPATAAALVVLHYLGKDAPARTIDWLFDRVSSSGGFTAVPNAPVADLLSTATAVFALKTIGVPLDSITESTLDFVDMLWDTRGGFHGNIYDQALDCEYTFYGLLAIGAVS